MNESKLEILYEDDDIVICIKPAGVNSTDIPGGMPGMLRQKLLCSDIRSVHRLDQMVSGLMIYAKNKKSARTASSEIINKDFEKYYLAVVHGNPVPKNGAMNDYLKRNKEERKTYSVPEGTPYSQLAQLRYQVLDQKNEFSLVKIKLITGRTHQIRCQFSSRNMPIVGDRKYSVFQQYDFPMALWSYKLSFKHPVCGKRIIAQKNPPQEEPWNWFTLQEIQNSIEII